MKIKYDPIVTQFKDSPNPTFTVTFTPESDKEIRDLLNIFQRGTLKLDVSFASTELVQPFQPHDSIILTKKA
jgi:hypothetical protein